MLRRPRTASRRTSLEEPTQAETAAVHKASFRSQWIRTPDRVRSLIGSWQIKQKALQGAFCRRHHASMSGRKERLARSILDLRGPNFFHRPGNRRGHRDVIEILGHLGA